MTDRNRRTDVARKRLALLLAAAAAVSAGFFVLQPDYEGEGAVGFIPMDSRSIDVSGGSSEIAFNFVIDETLDGIQSGHVHITPESDASGVIKIGRYSNSRFAPIAEIKLSNISAMDLGIIGYFNTGPEAPPEGAAEALFTVDNKYVGGKYPQTIELISGAVLAGTYGVDDRLLPPGERGSFSGKIVSGGAAVESVNTSGLFASSKNDSSSFFGTVFGAQYYLDSLDGPSPRILMSGDARIEYPASYALPAVLRSDSMDCGSLYFVDVDVSISDKAKLIAGPSDTARDPPSAGHPSGTGAKEYHFGMVSYRVVRAALNVEGTLLLPYTQTSVSYMHVDGSVALSVSDGGGMVEYQTDPASLGLEYTGAAINSAYCATEQANTKRTHFYSSLKKALEISNEVFIAGEYRITSDVVLAGASGLSSITAMPDSKLQIGSEASSRSVTVTIPRGTVVNVHDGAVYEVVYGTLIKPNDGSRAAPISDTYFVKDDAMVFRDIHTALGNAQSGDVVHLTRRQPDAVVMTRSCTVEEGVTLFLENNILAVGNRSVLSVSGTILTNEREISTRVLFDAGTSLNVSPGGRVAFRGEYILISTLHVEKGGRAVIEAPAGEFAEGAKYLIDGDLTLMHDAAAATVAVAGSINSERIMSVREKLTVGRPPELISEMSNGAAVGRSTFLLEQGAVAIVFGSNDFSEANILGNTACTEFAIGAAVYAREYAGADADGTTETKIEYLPADSKDKDFHGWYTDPSFAGRFTVNDANNSVGSPHILFGKFTAKQIRLTLYYDPSVDWAVNGVSFGTSGSVGVDYGSSVSVSASASRGYAGHPTIVRDNVLYVSGTEYSAKEDSVFKVIGTEPHSNDLLNGESLLIEALLSILMAILVAMLSIIIKKR